jgi:hypothetical protein
MSGGAAGSDVVGAPGTVPDVGTPVIVIELMLDEAGPADRHPAGAITAGEGSRDGAGDRPGRKAPNVSVGAPNGSVGNPEKVQSDRAVRPADGTT